MLVGTECQNLLAGNIRCQTGSLSIRRLLGSTITDVSTCETAYVVRNFDCIIDSKIENKAANSPYSPQGS